jgi:Mg-chelatase subunit ChlD
MVMPGKEFFFVFVVDCSGSMAGSRMNTTKAALKLFMQSLPEGCAFAVIRFGRRHAMLSERNWWEYNDSTL